VALPAYDATKHHIGLGESAGALKGFVIEPGQRKVLQSAPRVAEFGSGEELINAPSLSRWTMDDFLGGAFWPTWSAQDPARFSSCKNFVPSQQGFTLRTVPPLVLWDDETGPTPTPGVFQNAVCTGDFLVLSFREELVRTKIADKSRTEFFSDNYGIGFEADSDYGYPILWVADSTGGGGGDTMQLRRYRTDTWATKTTYTHSGFPETTQLIAAEFDGVVPVFCWADGQLFTCGFNADETINPTWTKIGKIAGVPKKTCTYNGLVYILYVDFAGRTRISTTDGSTITPLVIFPYNFEGRALTSYGGRLYVVGTGRDFAGTDTYLELYELTGSTLRLIKTFAPEDRISGAIVPRGSSAVEVFEGLLWIACEGEYLVGYDLSTDALYGVSEVPNSGGTLTPKAMFVTRDQLFLYATHSNNSALTGYYRVAQTGDGVSSYSGEVVTADFGPEPSLEKAWSQVHLVSRYDVDNPTIDFSTDGGSNWTAASVSVTTEGTFKHTLADITPAGASRRIRLRFRFPRGSNVTNFSELVAFTVTFAFVETGKLSWMLTIPAISELETDAFTTEQADVSEIKAQLRTWSTASTHLIFRDWDNLEYKVQLRSVQEHAPAIGEPVDGAIREAFIILVLVEV
jgi:hypothetical protein